MLPSLAHNCRLGTLSGARCAAGGSNAAISRAAARLSGRPRLRCDRPRTVSGVKQLIHGQLMGQQPTNNVAITQQLGIEAVVFQRLAVDEDVRYLLQDQLGDPRYRLDL